MCGRCKQVGDGLVELVEELCEEVETVRRPTLIYEVLTPRDLWCKTLLSFSSRSTKWRKQRVFFSPLIPQSLNCIFQ